LVRVGGGVDEEQLAPSNPGTMPGGKSYHMLNEAMHLIQRV